MKLKIKLLLYFKYWYVCDINGSLNDKQHKQYKYIIIRSIYIEYSIVL